MLLCVSHSFAQKNPNVEKVHASIPVEQYKTPYTENPAGQKTMTFSFVDHSSGQPVQNTRHAQLYVPSHYSEEKKYPLIVLLHGAKRSGVSLVEKWMPLAEKEGLILIGPTHPRQGWPFNGIEAELIELIINETAKKYTVDKSRIYLFGHSSGGHFASYMAVAKPELFAAITIHAGIFRDASHYERFEEQFGLVSRKTPMAFLSGNNDSIVPFKAVKNSAKIFAGHGHETLLVEYLDHNHWYYTIAPEINVRALQFMNKHRLP